MRFRPPCPPLPSLLALAAMLCVLHPPRTAHANAPTLALEPQDGALVVLYLGGMYGGAVMSGLMLADVANGRPSSSGVAVGELLTGGALAWMGFTNAMAFDDPTVGTYFGVWGCVLAGYGTLSLALPTGKDAQGERVWIRATPRPDGATLRLGGHF